MDITKHTSFVSFLQHLYKQSREKNASYSQRSFARKLGVGSPALSEIMSHKRAVTPNVALRMIDRLDLPPTDRDYLMTLSAIENAHEPRPKKRLKRKLEHYRIKRSGITFESGQQHPLCRSWLHTALLEFADIPEMKVTDESVSRYFGTTLSRTREVLKELTESGYLQRELGAYIKPQQKPVFCQLPATSEGALEDYHEGLLKLAMTKNRSKDSFEKDISSIMVRTHKSKIPEAKKMIQAFRRELMDFLEDGDHRGDDVFCFSAQLMSLQKTNAKPRQSVDHDA